MNFNNIRIRILQLSYTFFIFLLLSSCFNSYPQTNWNTELLGRWSEGTCEAVEVDENYIYVGNGSCIDVYEDLEIPVFVVRLETPGIIRDILRVEDYLYVANEEYGLRIFDISVINNPVEVGFILLPGYTQKLLFRDNIIYSANFHGGLRIIDVENPSDPIEISSYQTGFQVDDLAIKDNYLFITQGAQLYSGFIILEIIDSGIPVFIKKVYTLPMGYACRGLAVKDKNLLVITTDGAYGLTYSYSIIDPTNPELKYPSNIHGTMIVTKDDYAFITQFDEIKVVDISLQDTLFVVQIINSFGTKKSIKFKENVMYIADSYNGLVIVDINDLNNPIFKYHIPSAYNSGYLVVDNNLLYLSDMGLRILDVTDPYNPLRIGVFQTIYGTDKIFKKNNLIFLADANLGGIRIIDVSYPKEPLELSQIKPPQNLFNSITAYQDYLYLAQGDSLGIWDITTPYNPIHTNTIHLTGYCDEIIIKDNLLITCQDPGGILIYLLTDPIHPQLVSAFLPIYRIQNLALQSNYIIGGTSFGFEIIDIMNPVLPCQVSFFSTPYMYDIAAAKNYLYIAFAESGIKVYDLTNVSDPQKAGSYDTKGIAWSVDCWDDKIFVADSRYGVPIIKNTLITKIEEEQNVPLTFQLFQNYPNPFNLGTHLKYSIPKLSNVVIKVYDILGREISALVNEEKEGGIYDIFWDASNFSSGVYFYRLQGGDFIEIKKMILKK